MLREELMIRELKEWQLRMLRKPSMFSRVSKRIQDKINSWIPEKIHAAVTATIKQMVRGVLFGAEQVSRKKIPHNDLYVADEEAKASIKIYRNTASAEGALTGAAGFWLGLADFPILIAIKLKMLFDLAGIFGYDTNDYKERLFLLHIFQLAFSSDRNRKEVYLNMVNWTEKTRYLPNDIHQFDWRVFQQEYRDYIDLAKMAQLIPVIGAPVGAIANYHLLRKLGNTARFAYRMRWLEKNKQLQIR
ncbi:MAG TPA: EcsC family protein [Flavitalea sp.]|nr:EcsC family protein [Flavitalea sp.]